MTTHAAERIQAVASFINVLSPDTILWEQWIGALRSGAYKFGYGVLRSGEDEYDPFGVLAAIAGAAWVWDDAESAWAVDGDPCYLAPLKVAEWLGVPTDKATVKAGAEKWLTDFQTVVLDVADGAPSFEYIAALLAEGATRARAEQDRLHQRSSMVDRFDLEIGRPDQYLYRDSQSPYIGRRGL